MSRSVSTRSCRIRTSAATYC